MSRVFPVSVHSWYSLARAWRSSLQSARKWRYAPCGRLGGRGPGGEPDAGGSCFENSFMASAYCTCHSTALMQARLRSTSMALVRGLAASCQHPRIRDTGQRQLKPSVVLRQIRV